MPQVELHEDADKELKAAALFYESRESGLGNDFLQRVSQALDAIIDQPLIGQIVIRDIRRRLVRQFPTRLSIASKQIEYSCLPWPIGVVGLDSGKRGIN